MHIYNQISNRLSKKNLFRKLTDHLSSHRNFINDCMQQNLRLMRQSGSPRSKMTGLVVLDQLVQGIQQFSKTLIQARAPSIISHRDRPQPIVSGALDVRFEMIYFQTALEIYDSMPQLRAKVMESIIKYAANRE